MQADGMLGAVGGLGLFLLGMRLLTESLQSMAGSGMQRWLGRVTHTPWSGALTGMVATAVVRSSSATTVAAVGFVGAGMLSFEQALGVIFGANIGTTLTGWIVALFGFKFDLGRISLALVFAGALVSLLGRPRWQKAGAALAGFALLFIGLDLLKSGLAGMADGFSAETLGTKSAGGRLMWLGFGVVFSVLTQSSGATVATALAALDSGMIHLPQALAVAIGADVGTTASAWLASLGGTTDSRRTGLSHVIYNLLTGTVAFLLLPAYQQGLGRFAPGLLEAGAPFALVAFHSGFNLAGVLLVLPFTGHFAAWMRRLVPEHSPLPSAALNRRLLATPGVAIETLRHALVGTAEWAVECLAGALARPPVPTPAGRLEQIRRAIRDCRDFMGALSGAAAEPRERARLPGLLHTLDHIERLMDRCRDEQTIRYLDAEHALAHVANRLKTASEALRNWLHNPAAAPDPGPELEQLAVTLEDEHSLLRRRWIALAAAGELPPDTLDRVLDAHRWLRRTAWHAHRIAHYLAVNAPGASDAVPIPASIASAPRK